MNKKLIIVIAIVVIGVGILIGYIALFSRNTAKTEASNILEEFTSITSSQWYCENGSGKGIDNQTPWWEEIYLSNTQSNVTAQKVEEHFKNKGYSVSNEYIEDSQNSYNKGKSYWEIDGRNSNFSIQTRVSSKELTLNNCFKNSSNMNESLIPESFNSVIVIKFRDGI